MRGSTALATLALGMIGAGCGSNNNATPLSPREFVTPGKGVDTSVITKQTDQNGTLVYGDLHAPLLPDEYTNTHPQRPAPVSPSLQQAVTETQPASSRPAEQAVVVVPTSQPEQTTGTYQVVGTVVCIVNGHPIYADKVLAKLETQLAADARRMSYDQFKESATKTISEMVAAMVEDQKQIAAANEALGADEKKNADGFAAAWIDEQVKAAGGSRELAKEKALSETGETLNQLADEQRDQALVFSFYQAKLIPLIQVTPTDIRRYYEQNRATLYTQTAQAKFRLIRISAADRGGIEEAVLVAKRVIERLKGGTEFANLAKSTYNDDRVLRAAAGQVGQDGWVQKGSFIDDAVEDAVWKLNPGEYTETPIAISRDNTFAIAMLEAKKPGITRAFDDQVQQEIFNTLQKQQLTVLRGKLGASLDSQSVKIEVKGGLPTAVQMAMQRYPVWAVAK